MKWTIRTVVILGLGVILALVLRTIRETPNNPFVSWIYTDKVEASAHCAANLRELLSAVEIVGVDSSPYACFMDQQKPGEKIMSILGPEEKVDLIETRYIKDRKFLSCPQGGLYRVGATAACCSKHGLMPWSTKARSFVAGKDGVYEAEGEKWFVGPDFILHIKGDYLSFDSKGIHFDMRSRDYRSGERGIYISGSNLTVALDNGRKDTVAIANLRFFKQLQEAIEPFLQKR